MYFGAGGTTEFPWEIRPGAHETPTEDLQAFFQEWLFFGLIIEALDGNSETTSSSHLPATQQPADEPPPERNDVPFAELPPHRHKQTIVSRVYEEFVYQADMKSYITTKPLLAELRDSWTISLLSFHRTRNSLEVRCKRMRLCLRRAHYFYTHLPADFRPDIKFSIGAVAETIAHAMQSVCFWLKLEEFCPNEWGNGYYQNQEVRSRMENGGWCPSDLVRTVNKFKFLHTLHYLSFLDKRNPARSHTGCSNSSRCLADEMNETGGSRNHWKDGCSCREVEIDHEDIVSVLRTGNAVPLLVLKEGEQDIESTENEANASPEKVDQIIEVVRSTESTPYVAISHVSLSFCRRTKWLMSVDLVRWSRERERKLAQCLQAP
jgi:hypothetical protein